MIKIIWVLRCSGWRVTVLQLDNRQSNLDIEKMVAKSGNVDAIIRWDEHGCLFVNEEWLKTVHWMENRGITPLSIDFGYFDHYKSYSITRYRGDGANSIQKEWPDLSAVPDWSGGGERLSFYRRKKLHYWTLAENLPPLLPPGYILVFPQFNVFLSRFSVRNTDDWLMQIYNALSDLNIRMVVKMPPIIKKRPKLLPNNVAVVFDRHEKPDMNARLVKHARHSVILSSNISNELVLYDSPVVALGKSWFNSLDVFFEPSDLNNIAMTPHVNGAARGKWINWWIRHRFYLPVASTALEAAIFP